jgi:putative ABC transport system permease protein
VLLRQRHLGAEDFEMENEAADVLDDLAMADGILGGWNVVMFTIAGVTLIVGGIGLFSVLLISVRERVREIGIRKALGADDWEIRRLFLAESLTLALLGATLGVAGGVGLILLTKTVAQQFGSDFFIPLHVPGVVMAIGFALLVGLVFGWYPAKRASRLDPIEAIREL